MYKKNRLWNELRENGFWKSFIPALVMITIALSFQMMVNILNRPRNISREIGSCLGNKEKLLKSYMTIISEKYNPADGEDMGFTTAELGSMENEGLSVYVYIGDSLAYWSTNTFSAPNRITAEPEVIYPRLQKSANGYYLVYRKYSLNRVVEGRILLKHNYPFENEYLTNDFQDDFHVPEGTRILENSTSNPVFSSEGKYLFGINLPENPPLRESESIILVIIYLIALVFLIRSLLKFILSLPFSLSKPSIILIFAGSIILMRILQVFLHFPLILYKTTLFGPESFYSSFFFPSLGDFLINSICLLIISYVFYNLFSGIPRNPVKTWKKWIFLILIIAGFAAELFIAIFLMQDLVVNSTIPFNLQNFSNLNLESFIGFIIISAFFLSFFFISVRFSGWLAAMLGLRNRRWIRGMRLKKFSVTNLAVYLVFFSVFATITLNYYNSRVEKEKRKLMAIKFSAERDPVAEMIFAKIQPALMNDSVILDLLRQHKDGDSVLKIIQSKYFTDYWNNYSIQITNCAGSKILRVQPQNYLVQCDVYFQTLIRQIGEPTYSSNFYFLDYGYGFKNYLGIIPYISGDDTLRAYIEMSSKLVFKDLGYPELLVDKNQVQYPDLSDYSYAFYRNGRLINRVGAYHYSMTIEKMFTGFAKPVFLSVDGTNHYVFPIDEERSLILSRKENSLVDEISPFSYLFVFFSLFAIIFYLVTRFPSGFRPGWFGLGTRLQITMTLILVTSQVIIGLLVIFYINRLDNQKNQDNLSDRTHSMLVELQHKMGSEDSIRDNASLDELLTKFSNVFFSDVNIYDTNGRLLATSRPEIFDAGLMSRRMNGEAYRNLKINRLSYYLAEEHIGTNYYSSAYMPFYNENDHLLAYLNLPYFTRQEELKREVSSFLIAFINIYVFFIIIGIIISIIIAKYITRPLRLLTANIGRLGFGRKNEMLQWTRNDEVGKLVEEYNRMVAELEKSAGLLARSERESAWREMARQVAHEIKNPLTPMKLSVQHLQKAWKDKAPDWEDRLKRFTDTMTEQIETLAAIASEFSDFAKMPARKDEIIDIQELIDKTIVLYSDIATIKFIFNKPPAPLFIMADRKQINRVFTNLINNAVYAIGEKSEGVIVISVVAEKDAVLITLSDNGSGISREQADHIFQPNFTTKSGGMGLGLAIVKSIVQGTGGEIHFHSEEGKGTTFMLRFPSIKS